MLCQFLLYNKVSQPYAYKCPHIPSLLSLPPTLPIPPLQVVEKHRADLPVLCSCFPPSIYLFYIWQCIYVHSTLTSPRLPPPPAPCPIAFPFIPYFQDHSSLLGNYSYALSIHPPYLFLHVSISRKTHNIICVCIFFFYKWYYVTISFSFFLTFTVCSFNYFEIYLCF